MDNWIDVNDSLPFDFTKCTKYECVEVIVCSGGVVSVEDFTCGPRPKPWYNFGDFRKLYVSHWMPLPEPPNITKG